MDSQSLLLDALVTAVRACQYHLFHVASRLNMLDVVIFGFHPEPTNSAFSTFFILRIICPTYMKLSVMRVNLEFSFELEPAFFASELLLSGVGLIMSHVTVLARSYIVTFYALIRYNSG